MSLILRFLGFQRRIYLQMHRIYPGEAKEPKDTAISCCFSRFQSHYNPELHRICCFNGNCKLQQFRGRISTIPAAPSVETPRYHKDVAWPAAVCFFSFFTRFSCFLHVFFRVFMFLGVLCHLVMVFLCFIFRFNYFFLFSVSGRFLFFLFGGQFWFSSP